jgi:L-lactate dehydrogenase (cytochrome)
LISVEQFIEDHPGGKAPLLRVAGKDATRIFQALHPPGTLESGISPEKMVGLVDQSTVPMAETPAAMQEGTKGRKTPLSNIIGLPDFEVGDRR